eukprot:TRINITY_DN2273_c0_g1_i1.p1 TRINITY_DN2273_c0_g1~~TRINITY_DN2273_c0_g1_i1.p1  ORF type:complete len:316 (+),score=79.75 TRINITY_DN2273_c0_g1_i1:136-1083(+)
MANLLDLKEGNDSRTHSNILTKRVNNVETSRRFLYYIKSNFFLRACFEEILKKKYSLSNWAFWSHLTEIIDTPSPRNKEFLSNYLKDMYDIFLSQNSDEEVSIEGKLKEKWKGIINKEKAFEEEEVEKIFKDTRCSVELSMILDISSFQVQLQSNHLKYKNRAKLSHKNSPKTIEQMNQKLQNSFRINKNPENTRLFLELKRGIGPKRNFENFLKIKFPKKQATWTFWCQVSELIEISSFENFFPNFKFLYDQYLSKTASSFVKLDRSLKTKWKRFLDESLFKKGISKVELLVNELKSKLEISLEEMHSNFQSLK